MFSPLNLFNIGDTGDYWVADASDVSNRIVNGILVQGWASAAERYVVAWVGRYNGYILSKSDQEKLKWHSNVLNGKGIVRFFGCDYLKVIGSSVIDGTKPTTIIVVSRQFNANNSNLVSCSAGTLLQYTNNGTGVFATSPPVTSQSINTRDWHVISANFTIQNGDITSIRIDGGNSFDSLIGSRDTDTFGDLIIGGPLASNLPFQFLTGDIAEILIINRNLSLNELNSYGHYINNRYGLIWNLAV